MKEAYSDADIDHILDRVYRYVEQNPYRAYKTYINDFYDDMTGSRFFSMDVPKGLPFLLGIVAAALFIPLNWKSGSGSQSGGGHSGGGGGGGSHGGGGHSR